MKTRRIIIIALVLTRAGYLQAQTAEPALDSVTHNASFYFTKSDRSCIQGTILKADSTSIMVKPHETAPVSISKSDLAQVMQGKDLIYSSLSSWYDVIHVRVVDGETLVVTSTSGKQVRGTPLAVTEDHLTFKHVFSTSTYGKAEIAKVDYVRLRPATDDFGFVLEEAPWAIIFYPEFYSRVVHLEGHTIVHLYDASKPQIKLPPHCM